MGEKTKVLSHCRLINLLLEGNKVTRVVRFVFNCFLNERLTIFKVEHRLEGIEDECELCHVDSLWGNCTSAYETAQDDAETVLVYH